MSPGERRLAAIMFTDMVGYTAVSQKNEALAMRLLEEQREIVRPFFPKHHGREIKTMGDAFLVEFASALEAVRCAFDIQESLREANTARSGDRRIQVRIGVHLGDVIHSKNDVYGDAVNVASRIEPLSEPGGISVTEQVYEQVRNKFEFPFASIGRMDLKNVAGKTEVFKAVLPWDEQSGPGLDAHRIAVLPFVNLSSDPADEFFADGLTEELIDRLCHVKGLEVIARTSAMSFKKKDVKAADIGRELRAGALVEGSVRKAGKRIRVTAQLINANTEAHLWSSKYDRDLEDIFAVQTEIAEQVAGALEVQLLPSEKERLEKKQTQSMEAYTLYLNGRHLWNKRSKDSVGQALECFEHACELDPDYALAYVGISDCYTVMASWGYRPVAEVIPKGKQAILMALKLDNNLAEAHTSYAMMLSNEWRWEESELEFKRAIELNPNYATAHQWYGYSVLRYMRRVEEEMREVERALELDPLAPIMVYNKGLSLYFQERYDEAIACSKRTVAIDPGFIRAYLVEALCYTMSGRHSEATSMAEKYEPQSGQSETVQKLDLVFNYGKAGREADARRLLAEALASSDRSADPTDFAWAYLGIGDTEKMFESFQDALLRRIPRLPYDLIDPALKPFQSDPRLQELKRKVGI